MKKYLSLIIVFLISNYAWAHQTDLVDGFCKETEVKIGSAKNIEGRLMHDYIEKCGLSMLPVISSNAIDAMQGIINEELIRRGRSPVGLDDNTK